MEELQEAKGVQEGKKQNGNDIFQIKEKIYEMMNFIQSTLEKAIIQISKV